MKTLKSTILSTQRTLLSLRGSRVLLTNQELNAMPYLDLQRLAASMVIELLEIETQAFNSYHNKLIDYEDYIFIHKPIARLLKAFDKHCNK